MFKDDSALVVDNEERFQVSKKIWHCIQEEKAKDESKCQVLLAMNKKRLQTI